MAPIVHPTPAGGRLARHLSTLDDDERPCRRPAGASTIEASITSRSPSDAAQHPRRPGSHLAHRPVGRRRRRRSAPSRATAPAPPPRSPTARTAPDLRPVAPVPPLDSGETIRGMSDGVVYLTLDRRVRLPHRRRARLGAGSYHSLLRALSPRSGVRDWPTGVQEGDAPRFAVSHLDGLMPDRPMTVDVTPIAPDDPLDAPRSELLDLGSRHLDAP